MGIVDFVKKITGGKDKVKIKNKKMKKDTDVLDLDELYEIFEELDED